MYPYNSLQKKRKLEFLVEPNQDSFRTLSDVTGDEQGELEDRAGERASGVEFHFENEGEELQELGIIPDDEDEVKQLLSEKKSSSKSYREKREKLYTKWAEVHEQLSWELLCFQAVNPKGNNRELSPCMCPGRAQKKVECISLEGTL
jgi:hypothetical protein